MQEPYIKITLGKIGSLKSETFELGTSDLVKCSVNLNEGYALSNCEFSVLDPDKKLLDKYLAYIESVDGLEGFRSLEDKAESPQINNNPPQDAAITPDGKLIFASTKASLFVDGTGSMDNKLDTINENFCAMRYNNPPAAKQFGSAGMISYLNYGDQVRATNPANGKSVIVTVADWGPNPKPSLLDRGIDLSVKAFNILAGTNSVTAANAIGLLNNIKVELVSKRSPTVSTTAKTQEQKKKVEEIQANRVKTSASTSTAIDKVKSSINAAKTPKQESLPTSTTRSGCQITVELGFDGKTISAHSFIHTSLSFDLFNSNLLTFGGSAANWVMGQRVKNTSYTKMTFRKVAEKICKSYGMTLVMNESGPYYEYLPQNSKSDINFIVSEANRLGFRVTAKGKVLTIQSRAEAISKSPVFTLGYGDNMGLSFTINHRADQSGGARDIKARNSTGELKFEIDPDTGETKQQRKENIKGLGDDTTAGLSGSKYPEPKPKTDGITLDKDNQRKSDEERVKGIQANATFPATEESLLINPDSPFKTDGISIASDRFWIVESVNHIYEGSLTTSVSLYSPLKNKNPSARINNPTSTSATVLPTATGQNIPFDPNAPRFIRPVSKQFPISSGFRAPGRANHKGCDLACPIGTPIQAAASGTVIAVQEGCKIGNSSCGLGFGNFVLVGCGGGWTFRDAHLDRVVVNVGDVVQQGQIIAYSSTTGSSTGPHDHHQIEKNGIPINPQRFW